MSDGQQQQRQSGQSSKATTAISPPNEPKSLPPIKHLPLRKRLALEASIKITPKVSPKEEAAEPQSLTTPATVEEEYPPTPGSQHSSSSGGSSDSTIPIVHSPPSPPPQKSEKVLKQPLKKAYHWSRGKGTTGGTTSATTSATTSTNTNTTTAATTTTIRGNGTINRNKLTLNNGGLPGNPLLLNNGDADKYVREKVEYIVVYTQHTDYTYIKYRITGLQQRIRLIHLNQRGWERMLRMTVTTGRKKRNP